MSYSRINMVNVKNIMTMKPYQILIHAKPFHFCIIITIWLYGSERFQGSQNYMGGFSSIL